MVGYIVDHDGLLQTHVAYATHLARCASHVGPGRKAGAQPQSCVFEDQDGEETKNRREQMRGFFKWHVQLTKSNLDVDVPTSMAQYWQHAACLQVGFGPHRQTGN